MTLIEKAIKDAELYQKESSDKIREWSIRQEERQRHIDTLRILNKR
tara:strand:+ start:393 stop:530 length:138 start_codon:yes stop_codon:yes gene_type:complete